MAYFPPRVCSEGETELIQVLGVCVSANSKDEYSLWMKGLNYLVRETQEALYQLQLERWLRKEFYMMEKVGTEV